MVTRFALIAFAVTFMTVNPRARSEETVAVYRRDIQPILAEYCFHCHGADANSRSGALRLDLREAALVGGYSKVPAIVPGKPEASALIARLEHADLDLRMPPSEEKKSLSPKQIETLKAWIRQGAPYEAHWAFESPRKVELQPEGKHPIDQLVSKVWAQEKVLPSPRESAHVLCRRLYLDVIGLPPTLEELEAFEKEGLEATLERLLKSERYGEKWARVWLDVARYSDTNGYEKDLRREQWIWRDWVVRALNEDKPYNEFLIEQIGGDLLPNATQEQVIATGFLRNSMLNEEGAIVPEQFRMFEMFDRMDCVGKAVLGLTTQCSQCHNHKFDPLTQEDYYGMFAYLNNAYESQSWIYNAKQWEAKKTVEDSLRQSIAAIRQENGDWKESIAKWSQELSAAKPQWRPLAFHQLESVSGLNHPVQLQDQSILMLGHSSSDVFFVGAYEGTGLTGVQLEVLTHEDLPFRGPGRSGQGTWEIHELEILTRTPEKKEWEKQKLVHATADFSEPEQKQDKRSTGPVAHLIDGKDENSWKADRGVGRRNQASVAVVQFEKPLDLPAGSEVKVVLRMGAMVGCCRVSLTASAAPVAPAIDHQVILALDAAKIHEEQAHADDVVEAWARYHKRSPERLVEMDQAWKKYPQAETSVLHLRERSGDFVRVTHWLDRGEWDKRKQEVKPHVPGFLHAWDPSWENNRLGFARWLASERSPLTARVAVNRMWQSLFGEGLVDVAEDFGNRTTTPLQVELLDWLAVDFMEHHWSQKHLLKTIVTSGVYQQSSRIEPEALDRDPKNRWLARGPRFRCDAEVIRDVALRVSGLLVDKMGGPSVIPPVPQNVLDYNYVYPSYWTAAQSPERYRRTLYCFRKRSMPDPAMTSLDAPNGDLSCARRVRSNTPLAALTGWNEPIFVEAAQALALRILKEGGDTELERIQHAYRLCVSRLPSESEEEAMLHFLRDARKRIAEGWVNAKEIASGDATKLPTLPVGTTPQDAAAWTLLSRVLLNLDETITKN
ncbi:MAG: PSD1 and planctomycete cytochrome C domain-containing protein [Pirellulales bacterium]